MNTKGSATIMVGMSLALISVGLISLVEFSRLQKLSLKNINAADAAAISGATCLAKALNGLSSLNLVMDTLHIGLKAAEAAIIPTVGESLVQVRILASAIKATAKAQNALQKTSQTLCTALMFSIAVKNGAVLISLLDGSEKRFSKLKLTLPTKRIKIPDPIYGSLPGRLILKPNFKSKLFIKVRTTLPYRTSLSWLSLRNFSATASAIPTNGDKFLLIPKMER